MNLEGAREFLVDVWPELEGHYILVWTLPDRLSKWFQDVEAAAKYAVEASGDGRDVYVQVGASPEDFGPKARCRREQVAAIPGVWAEVDVINSEHSEGFESEAAALEFIHGAPELTPSLVVKTGGGFHVWWLFREAWVFESPAEREQAASYVYGWWRTLADKAALRGGTLDPVWDMARILRIPGTVNHKYGLEVELLEDSGARFQPSEFELFSRRPPRKADAGGGDFGVDGPLNMKKFEALCDLDPHFNASFKKRRPTAGMTDDSFSSFDFSHVMKALNAGWHPWKEVPALIWTFRDLHGTENDKAKGRRRDYITRTVLRALERVEANEEESQRAEVAEDSLRRVSQMVDVERSRRAENAAESPVGFRITDPVQRETVLKMLRTNLGVPIRGVRQYGDGRNCTFSVLVDGAGEVQIGDAKRFMLAADWQAALISKGVGMVRPVPKVWAKVWPAAALIADVRIEPDTEEVAKVRDFLRALLKRAKTDKLLALSQGSPLLENGRLYFPMQALERQAHAFDRRLERSSLRQALSVMGVGKGGTVSAWSKEDSKSVSRYLYSIELEVLEGREE